MERKNSTHQENESRLRRECVDGDERQRVWEVALSRAHEAEPGRSHDVTTQAAQSAHSHQTGDHVGTDPEI